MNKYICIFSMIVALGAPVTALSQDDQNFRRTENSIQNSDLAKGWAQCEQACYDTRTRCLSSGDVGICDPLYDRCVARCDAKSTIEGDVFLENTASDMDSLLNRLDSNQKALFGCHTKCEIRDGGLRCTIDC